MMLYNVNKYLVGLVLLWFYGFGMASVLRWLPHRLEKWLARKLPPSPVKRTAQKK